MVQYLHFRILKLPLIVGQHEWNSSSNMLAACSTFVDVAMAGD
jgi:hypothetical protein